MRSVQRTRVDPIESGAGPARVVDTRSSRCAAGGAEAAGVPSADPTVCFINPSIRLLPMKKEQKKEALTLYPIHREKGY